MPAGGVPCGRVFCGVPGAGMPGGGVPPCGSGVAEKPGGKGVELAFGAEFVFELVVV